MHLCGKQLWIEQHTVTAADPEGRRNGVTPEHCLVPPHPLLQDNPGQQMMAILLLVGNRYQDCAKVFGKNMLEPASIQSVREAGPTSNPSSLLTGFLFSFDQTMHTLKANMGHADARRQMTPTAVSVPQAIKYIKKMLKARITWDGGMRRLVSLWYRGSVSAEAALSTFLPDVTRCCHAQVLYGMLMRLLGMAGEAYEHISCGPPRYC